MIRVDRQVQSCALACSRMGARACVDLPPGGPGDRSGLVSGGLFPGLAAIGCAGFLETNDCLLLLAEN